VTRTIASAKGFSVSEAETLKKQHGFGNGNAPYDRASIELVFSRIFEEAKRALSKYETAHDKPVAAVVLTGGGGVTKELAAYAKDFFKREVRVADPFSKVSAPAFMRPVLSEIGPEFAVAVGLALRKLEEGA
jgi:Tfp pilus assembly PilM family ATPase